MADLTPQFRFTSRVDGDLRVKGEESDLEARRRAIHPAPWSWLNQVHGAEVLVVTKPGEHAGASADALVTTVAHAPLAIHTADCAPVLLVGEGALGVVHAGWRGLGAGILEATAAVMANLGHPPTAAHLGPCIRGRCYEFGESERQALVERYGPAVATSTAWGTPALEVAAGVKVAMEAIGVPLRDVGTCTACSNQHWSHRRGGDIGRQALVAWLEP